MTASSPWACSPPVAPPRVARYGRRLLPNGNSSAWRTAMSPVPRITPRQARDGKGREHAIWHMKGAEYRHNILSSEQFGHISSSATHLFAKRRAMTSYLRRDRLSEDTQDMPDLKSKIPA